MRFIKMDACGNDYIYVDAAELAAASELAASSELATAAELTAASELAAASEPATAKKMAPASAGMEAVHTLAVKYSDRHHGIGADGLVLIDKSEVADAKMRMFNADGSEGRMCGNAIRCVGWLLYERTGKRKLTIETLSGVRALEIQEPEVSGCQKPGPGLHGGVVTVNMGPVHLKPSEIPVCLPGERVVARKVKISGAACHPGLGSAVISGEAIGGADKGIAGSIAEYSITCVSMGNPHCVIRVSDVETVDVLGIGSTIENCAELFPERVNVEFVEIVDSTTLKMRVWERGSGETLACGTGACAAVTAAVLQGISPADEEITVQLRGGELQIRYTEAAVFMTGSCRKVYTGEIF